MVIAIDPSRITIVTATGLEAGAARRALPLNVRVLEGGVALARVNEACEVAISCGVAGGLRDDLATRTVLVPRAVRRPDGSMLECDAEIQEALAAAARALGHEPVDEPLVTAREIVHGAQRARFASEGYAAVDMETGVIRASRVGCIRVVLDTPRNELSPAWLHPVRAFLTPSAWRDLPFLAREGPRCANLAARILADALHGTHIP